MATLSTWDVFNRNMQSGLTEGQFMAAQYTMVAAGPPNLGFLTDEDLTNDEDIIGSSGDNLVFPMGVTQRLGFNQQRQHARVNEIGSERSYWISGRTVGQISLGRIVYHGPNLLRVLYAYYQSKSSDSRYAFPHLMGDSRTIENANSQRNPHSIQISPGYKNMFLNLASDLFLQTIGLLIYFKDSNDETVYAQYAENCVIPQHNIGVDAGGTVIQEGATVQFERMIPVHLSDAIEITDIDSSGRISRPGTYLDARTGRNF